MVVGMPIHRPLHRRPRLSLVPSLSVMRAVALNREGPIAGGRRTLRVMAPAMEDMR